MHVWFLHACIRGSCTDALGGSTAGGLSGSMQLYHCGCIAAHLYSNLHRHSGVESILLRHDEQPSVLLGPLDTTLEGCGLLGSFVWLVPVLLAFVAVACSACKVLLWVMRSMWQPPWCKWILLCCCSVCTSGRQLHATMLGLAQAQVPALQCCCFRIHGGAWACCLQHHAAQVVGVLRAALSCADIFW